MDIREKLVELLRNSPHLDTVKGYKGNDCTFEQGADWLIAHGVTVQECGEWVHPKGYVVSNGFLCSKCGHEEASYYHINQRSGGVYIADENGNFFYPPKLNYCPNCGAKMMPQPPKGETNNA